MDKTRYVGKWLLYPWLKNNEIDHWIHEEDFDKIDGVSIAKCTGIDGNYLILNNKNNTFRASSEGVNRILDEPTYVYGDMVKILGKSNCEAIIGDLFWHSKDEEYKYYLIIDGKKKSKYYTSKDFETLK
ncbi:hypothetical protein [uncultured Algibacter sp.]|uniref:hypothetical protein n=1 Tax=uncultured Algibacter sp. TaxID=298659 RepID=UPI003216E92A